MKEGKGSGTSNQRSYEAAGLVCKDQREQVSCDVTQEVGIILCNFTAAETGDFKGNGIHTGRQADRHKAWIPQRPRSPWQTAMKRSENLDNDVLLVRGNNTNIL